MTATFNSKAEVKAFLPKVIKELPDNKLRIEDYISFMGRHYYAIGIYAAHDDSKFLGYY